MPHPPEHKLRWYQYKLSSLFVLMTLVALAGSWYANEMFKATERRKAIAEIEKLGGGVWYYDASDPHFYGGEPPAWFSWLRRLHGDEHLGNAVSIWLANPPVTDAGLVHLKGLTKLESLYLFHTQVTDTGLQHLKELTNLKALSLTDTQITDAGLVHLKDLTNLEGLYFWNMQITDAGLEHLKGLTSLEYLDVSRTQVTDEAVKKLRDALLNCKIVHQPPPYAK
jgi:hypothetical protein